MPVDSQRSTVSGDSFELIPEGVYTAEVLDVSFIDKTEDKNTQFTPKDKFKFVLAILDEGEYRGRLAWHRVTTVFTSGFKGSPSKLYEFVCAVMGEKVDDSMEIDVNTLIGGQLKIVIKHKNGWANVVEVMKAGTKLEELPENERNELLKSLEPKEEVDVEQVAKEIDDGLNDDLDNVLAQLKQD